MQPAPHEQCPPPLQGNESQGKPMNITITLATPADAHDMAEIHIRSWEAAYKDIIPADYIKAKNATRHELWQRILTPDNEKQHIIRANGKTAGMLSVDLPHDEIGDEYYELHGIYLFPEYFRQGIGTKAVNFAFDQARKLGKRQMILWCFAENTNSIKFYEKFGFTPDGNTQEHDHGTKVNVSIRMTAEIQP